MRAFKFLIAPLLAAVGGAQAGSLPYFEVLAPISDQAVLQRGQDIVIPGFGEDGDTVRVQLRGVGEPVETSTQVVDGKWRAVLPAMKAGGPVEISIKSSSGASREFSDVYIGDVWLASGQSNMNWDLKATSEADQWIQNSDIPELRFFVVPETAGSEPADNVAGQWTLSSPQTSGEFSAVAWHFGRKLQSELNIPVGVIQSAVGGTIAICWTSDEALSKNPKYSEYHSSYERREERYSDDYSKGSPPSSPQRRRPSTYFNGMIHPLKDIPITGIIWYQGESDSWQADDYYRLFPDLITDWRNAWAKPDLPFLYVQLAGFDGKSGVSNNYPYIREAQEKALTLSNTTMVTAFDVGEENDIHPRWKRPVGERLAAAALTKVYQSPTPYSGPRIIDVHQDGSSLMVDFDPDSGKLKSSDGEAPRGFEIASTPDNFQPASAKIAGPHQIVLKSDDIDDPKYVRYAWTGYIQGNLTNEEGLPAFPYRNDNQPWSRN